jgi:hypothetical protein
VPKHALDRTGAPALLVSGHCAVALTTPPMGGAKWPRTYSARLILGDGGGAGVGVAFHSAHPNEPPAAWAWSNRDPEQLIRRVTAWWRAHDPAALLLGFPPAAQFDRKRLHVASQLRGALGGLLSDLWAHLPGGLDD